MQWAISVIFDICIHSDFTIFFLFLIYFLDVLDKEYYSFNSCIQRRLIKKFMQWISVSVARKKWQVSFDATCKCRLDFLHGYHLKRSLTHSELFLTRKKPYHQIGNTNFFIFYYKLVNLDVLCRQNKIWTFGHPFQSKKLLICTNSDLQSLYMLPIWGFTDYFT